MKSAANYTFSLRMPADTSDTLKKQRATSRTHLHTRRSSDVCCQNSSVNHANSVRPSFPIQESLYGTSSILHKVQTTSNLHDRTSWNRQSEGHWYNRPSDLFAPSTILQYKQPTSRTLSLHGTAATFSNDFDLQMLREENVKLRYENEQLRFELKIVKQRQSQNETNYDSIKNRLMNQRDETKKTMERLTRQLQEQNVTLEQTNKEKCLYQQIVQKLQERLQILMAQNNDLRKLLEHQQRQDKLLIELQQQFEDTKQEFQKLQRAVQEDDMDWEMHKHMWVQQKQYYREIIRKLQFQVNQLSL